MYSFLWSCALALAVFVLWILFHSWRIRCAKQRREHKNGSKHEFYTTSTKLIEPSNIFHGRWSGDDDVRVTFDATTGGVWNESGHSIRFTYSRVYDAAKGGGVWTAVVRTTENASILPLHTAFECLSQNSGQLRIPLFAADQVGEHRDLILTRDTQ